MEPKLGMSRFESVANRDQRLATMNIFRCWRLSIVSHPKIVIATCATITLLSLSAVTNTLASDAIIFADDFENALTTRDLLKSDKSRWTNYQQTPATNRITQSNNVGSASESSWDRPALLCPPIHFQRV
jgi:hypothetical protein